MNIQVQILGDFGQQFLTCEDGCVYFFGKIEAATIRF